MVNKRNRKLIYPPKVINLELNVFTTLQRWIYGYFSLVPREPRGDYKILTFPNVTYSKNPGDLSQQVVAFTRYIFQSGLTSPASEFPWMCHFFFSRCINICDTYNNGHYASKTRACIQVTHLMQPSLLYEFYCAHFAFSCYDDVFTRVCQ